MTDALKLAIKLTRRDMRRTSMKLDEEMRAALSGAIGTAEWDRGMSARDMRVFLAGYCMGLERATKLALKWEQYGLAKAIHALGDGA